MSFVSMPRSQCISRSRRRYNIRLCPFSKMPCRHHDVQIFDNMRCCLACGETQLESPPDQSTVAQCSRRAPYKYARLNYAFGQEIRLVILFPGRPTDEIEVDIVHVDVANHPPYEAISYAWATQDGDDSRSQSVLCHGGTISITKTCEAALKLLRRQGRSRYLWVDAVCIDQGNITERNHQVAFMGTIFGNASQIVIYLGPGSEVTDRVLDYLNGNSTALLEVKRDRLNVIIRDFLQHRWLDRVWVLQEIALARLATMMAGEKTARWSSDSINKVLGLCINLSIEPPSALRWLPASQPEPDILTVLHKSRHCSATDARDKVFAVLGLAHEQFQKEFPIDYSLSTEEVFTQLATHLIQSRGDLRVLKHTTGQGMDFEVHGIPSWVPRWDIKAGYVPLPAQFSASEMDNLASTWFTPKTLDDTWASEESNELVLEKVLGCLPQAEPVSTAVWFHWLKILGEKMSSALPLTRLYAPSFHFSIESRETRFHCQSIAAWGEAHNSPGVSTSMWPCLRVRAHHLDTISKLLGIRSVDQVRLLPKTLPQAFGQHHLCRPCKPHFVAKPICQKQPSMARAMLDEFTRDMKRLLGDGKTMFQTEQSIGIARADLLVGDSIFALDGADVPFVLRRVDNHYVLVGECFLYRALRHHLCICCGCEVDAWLVTTQIIDIW